jgi:aryl-alcohol dehydrogenase-like predicted oxidoreductase
MEYRNLGRSGLKVSTLCLGGMTFGEPDEGSMMHGVASSAEESHRIIDRALEAGVNFIDTANVYGQEGLSERVLGEWFDRTGRRDEVVLATKFRFTMQDRPNGGGASRRHIIEACEASLERLQTDYIDLYQIHMQDIETPEQETLRALDDLVRSGKVRYIGCSNYAAYRMMQSLWTSDVQNLERFVSLQAQYSLIERSLEREHVPICREHGLGILPWSPLGGGFLTGKYTRDQAPDSGTRLGEKEQFWKQTDTEQNWEILDALREVADQADASPAQVALHWLTRRPQVTSVIFGARTMEQLEENLEAAELDLSDEAIARLDEVSAPDYGYPYSFLQNIQGRW